MRNQTKRGGLKGKEWGKCRIKSIDGCVNIKSMKGDKKRVTRIKGASIPTAHQWIPIYNKQRRLSDEGGHPDRVQYRHALYCFGVGQWGEMYRHKHYTTCRLVWKMLSDSMTCQI